MEQQEYRMPAGTLLYAVYSLHRRGIYGLPNQMPLLSDKSFPLFAQEAEAALMEMGLGTLDFDGNFTLEDPFARLLGRCADCRSLVGASLRNGGIWRKLTLYAAGAVLERDEDDFCTLRLEEEPLEFLAEALTLPEDPAEPLTPLLADTDLLEKRDRAGLLAAGCGPREGDMVLEALDGRGGYAHLRYIEEGSHTGELLLLYGGAGILSAEAEYSEKQEFLRLTPRTREEVLAALERGRFREEEA